MTRAARPARRAGVGLAALIAGAVLVVLVGGCSLLDRPPEILDGLSVGSRLDCGACDQPDTASNCGDCDSLRTLAIRHLAESWPTHPPVAGWSFHREGWYPGASGEKILSTRSGSLVVAVATLEEGVRRAVSIYCGVGGCR